MTMKAIWTAITGYKTYALVVVLALINNFGIQWGMTPEQVKVVTDALIGLIAANKIIQTKIDAAK
jgi:hypothetical protein